MSRIPLKVEASKLAGFVDVAESPQQLIELMRHLAGKFLTRHGNSSIGSPCDFVSAVPQRSQLRRQFER